MPGSGSVAAGAAPVWSTAGKSTPDDIVFHHTRRQEKQKSASIVNDRPPVGRFGCGKPSTRLRGDPKRSDPVTG